MAMIKMMLDGLGHWPDLAGKALVDQMGEDAPAIQLALVKQGMVSGKSSVRIRLDLPDGSVLLTEVSLALWVHAARALELADRRGGSRK